MTLHHPAPRSALQPCRTTITAVLGARHRATQRIHRIARHL